MTSPVPSSIDLCLSIEYNWQHEEARLYVPITEYVEGGVSINNNNAIYNRHKA